MVSAYALFASYAAIAICGFWAGGVLLIDRKQFERVHCDALPDDAGRAAKGVAFASMFLVPGWLIAMTASFANPVKTDGAYHLWRQSEPMGGGHFVVMVAAFFLAAYCVNAETAVGRRLSGRVGRFLWLDKKRLETMNEREPALHVALGCIVFGMFWSFGIAMASGMIVQLAVDLGPLAALGIFGWLMMAGAGFVLMVAIARDGLHGDGLPESWRGVAR